MESDKIFAFIAVVFESGPFDQILDFKWTVQINLTVGSKSENWVDTCQALIGPSLFFRSLMGVHCTRLKKKKTNPGVTHVRGLRQTERAGRRAKLARAPGQRAVSLAIANRCTSLFCLLLLFSGLARRFPSCSCSDLRPLQMLLHHCA